MKYGERTGIVAPRRATASSPVGNRDSVGKTSISSLLKTFPESTRNTASTHKKSSVGLSDPYLTIDHYEADEIRRLSQHQRRLERRTQIAFPQQKKLSSLPLKNNHRTHLNDERSNTQADQAGEEHQSCKPSLSPVVGSVYTCLMQRGDLRRECPAGSSRTTTEGRFRPRPVLQRSTCVELTQNDQIAQLALSAQRPHYPLRTEQSDKQKAVKWRFQGKRAKLQQARRKQLFVANQHKQPAVNKISSKMRGSRPPREQSGVCSQQGRTFADKTQPTLKPSAPMLSSFSKSKEFRHVSNGPASPSGHSRPSISTTSRERQGRGGRAFFCQALFCKRKAPTSHVEWRKHLKYTLLRVRELFNQLTTCDFLEHHRPGNHAPCEQKIMQTQPWLEALLLSLASTLKTGPPGGTLQETASLLSFLRQQRSSALCAGEIRHLLKSVMVSLRRKFQNKGGETICCTRFYATSEKATSPFGVRGNCFVEVKAACSRSPSQADKPRTTTNSQVDAVEQQQQVTAWKAGFFQRQRLKSVKSQKLSGKTPMLVSVQQPTNTPSVQCSRNHAYVTTTMQLLSSLVSQQAVTSKYNSRASVRSCASLSGTRGSSEQPCRHPHSRHFLASSGEALQCPSRLEEADSKAAVTLQCFEELSNLDIVQRTPTSVSVDARCSSHEEVLLHHADASENFVLRVPKGQLPFRGNTSYAPGTPEPVNGQQRKEGFHAHAVRHLDFSCLVRKLKAFREVRRGSQALSVPFLYEESLQRELRQLEESLGVCKLSNDATAGLWTLQAATAERVLQRELQQVIHLVNDAVSAFVEGILAIEAFRMANIVHAIYRAKAQPQH